MFFFAMSMHAARAETVPDRPSSSAFSAAVRSVLGDLRFRTASPKREASHIPKSRIPFGPHL
jgi:hypothetical protein